jgi:hypothetical protein
VHRPISVVFTVIFLRAGGYLGKAVVESELSLACLLCRLDWTPLFGCHLLGWLSLEATAVARVIVQIFFTANATLNNKEVVCLHSCERS